MHVLILAGASDEHTRVRARVLASFPARNRPLSVPSAVADGAGARSCPRVIKDGVAVLVTLARVALTGRLKPPTWRSKLTWTGSLTVQQRGQRSVVRTDLCRNLRMVPNHP